MMTATAAERGLPEGDTSALEDPAGLSRAWQGIYGITADGGTWHAEPAGGGETVTAESAGGVRLAPRDARDAR